MKIRENTAIAKLTTMRLGGKARYVLDIEQKDDIVSAYNFAKTQKLPIFVLGAGSNVIGRDDGFPGVILRMRIKGMSLDREDADGARFSANAGETLDDFVRFGTKRGYSGMEALSAIPGTVGAGPVQNVGAYGQEIGDVLTKVEAFDLKTGRFCVLPAEKLHFGYRRSIFNHGKDAGRYLIIGITVRLTKQSLKPPFYTSLQAYLDKNQIHDYTPETIRRAVRAVRAEKLPDPKKIASSGSFFKNVYLNDAQTATAKANGVPVWDGGKVPSGWLIEHAGLKGKLLHGMRVWDKACLVLVNESAKNYADLAKARTEIQAEIRQKFGFELEQEPIELGVGAGAGSFAGGGADDAGGGAKARAGGGGADRGAKARMGGSTGAGKPLSGRELAGYIKNRQAKQVKKLQKKLGRAPKLLIFYDNDSPVIATYMRLKKRYGADIGVTVEAVKVTADDAEKRLRAVAKDPQTDAIIVQLPLTEATTDILRLIPAEKDVDGLRGDSDTATATAIHWLLTGHGVELGDGKKLALVGRGKLVGAPLEKMWRASGYDVTVFTKGDDLNALVNYDVVVTATGAPGIIKSAMLRKGAVVVDAGTASEDGVIKGDLDEAVRTRTDLRLTPKVGGVGPLTIAVLFEKLLEKVS